MGTLPKLSNPNPLRQSYQVQFGGLNHNKGARDGELYDMKNLTSNHYPVLCPREKRKLVTTLENATGGMISYGGVIVYTDGSSLKVLRDNVSKTVGEVTEGEKVFAPFRNLVLVFPDKVAVNIDDDTVTALEEEITLASAVFQFRGMLYGEAAENNTIYSAGADFTHHFKAGDAIEIDGCNVEANNKTPIVREVEAEYLRFYENVFTTLPSKYSFTAKNTLPATGAEFADKIYYGFIQDGNEVSFLLPSDALMGSKLEWFVGASSVKYYAANADGVLAAAVDLPLSDHSITATIDFIATYNDVTETNITLKRTIPDMDFVISDDNRLWGAKGNTIYGSKLGDPTNFNVFDGLSTDSYSVDIGNSGKITAALTYGGYPTFFKEDGIYRLYGDKPSNYQIMPTMKQGVKAGCEKSLAVAGEVLYYIGMNGIMAYTGGVPTKADEALGIDVIDGVAVSDGIKYYISATEDGEHYSLYVFDTSKGLWFKEDDLKLTYAVYDRCLLGLSDNGELWSLDGSVGVDEPDVEWFAEFADMTYGSPNQKGIGKMHIRFDLARDAEAKVEISYDNGDWMLVREFRGNGKRSNVLPIIPHRCDHFRVRMRGTGICDIYSMAVQYYNGSENY